MIKVDGKMGVIEFKNGRPKLLRGVKSGYRVAVSFICSEPVTATLLTIMLIASRYLGISRPNKRVDVTYSSASEMEKRECPVGATQGWL